MDSIPAPPPRNRAWQVLRFVCVLPAALIFAAAAFYAGGLAGALVTALFGATSPSIVYAIRLVLYYMPKNAAFVLAGAITAPRYRVTIALVLAALAIGVALIVHVLGQQSPGVVNYTHFAAETAGAALGVIALVAAPRCRRLWSPRRP